MEGTAICSLILDYFKLPSSYLGVVVGVSIFTVLLIPC